MANTKKLRAVIDAVLTSYGFTKRRSAWYRYYPETIVVLDLQKSDYGGQYYVNLAVTLRALNPEDYPPEHKCHIRMRLERIVDDAAKVSAVFNLEDSSIGAEERLQHIREMIKAGAEWLQRLSTVEAIVHELRSNESVRNRTILPARRFLKID